MEDDRPREGDPDRKTMGLLARDSSQSLKEILALQVWG